MGTFLEWKWLCPVFRVKWNRCLIAFISQCDSWSLHFSHGIVSTFTPCHTVVQWRLTPYTMSHGGAVTTDSYIHNITVKADPCTLSHGSAVTDNICILLVTILQRKAAFNPFIRCGSYRWPLHPVILWFRDSWPLHLVSHNISVTADSYILLLTIFQRQLTLTSCYC